MTPLLGSPQMPLGLFSATEVAAPGVFDEARPPVPANVVTSIEPDSEIFLTKWP